ncbi:22703_t:CDS:2, partial [Dentiscutata erythropus]
KLEVLNYKDKNPDISNVDIAKWVKETFSLNIHLSTVGRILKQNDNTFEEMPTMKRSRAVTYPELDDALHEWERLTIEICANASGTDKLELLVIGKYKDPRCFKNVNRRSLGVKYEANIKAWMTRMEGRKVILLLDGSKTHSIADQYEDGNSENNLNVLSATQFIALCFRNEMDIDSYIDYSEENMSEEILNDQEIVDFTRHSDDYINTEEPDDSIEIRQFTHYEALDALDTVNQYLLQQNDNMIEYINAISKIIKKVRSLRIGTLQQTNLDSFFASSSVSENEFEYNLTEADMFENTETEDFESD